jgi:hypothetical protein
MSNSGRIYAAALITLLAFVPTMIGQQSPTAWAAAANATTVPRLINYSGVLKDSSGRTLTTIQGVSFLLYKDEQGGAPLWLETQNVTPDKTGHYNVQLGAASASGIPADLFVNGEARWLAVQVTGEQEQPRVLLVAVPYAMKAEDAQTLGGLPASAFVLASPAAATNSEPISNSNSPTSSSAPPPASSNVTTAGGTANTIPLFTTATNIQNSILTQSGMTAVNVGGTLNLPATGTAISTSGFNSRAQDFVASVFNSGTKTAVSQTFQLQAEPTANNTSSASGTLNLLYAAGTGTPAETGLKINNKGLITFAAGQTFPGTGSGTVKSVASGAGLTGGPITSTGTLSIANAGVTNTMLANPSLTIKAGADLIGGGLVPLGGSATLNLDTTKVPTLGAASNTFTGTITASTLNSTGSVVGGVVVVNGALVADYANTNSGSFTPGLGLGSANSAAITSKQTSGGNQHGMDFWTDFTPRMSIASFGDVGIGTTNPYTLLHLSQNASGGLGPTLTLMNSGGGANASTSIDFDSYDPTPSNPPAVRVASIDDGSYSGSLAFLTKNPGSASNGLVEQVRIADYGSLIVDSSGSNGFAIGAGSAAGTGLIFGGTGSGEGIASCRSSTTSCFDSINQHQFGLDFYTNKFVRMSIFNDGDMFIWNCTSWNNGDHQGNCPSDARLKTNIQPFPKVLNKLAQLEPVHFDWNSSNPPQYQLGGGRQTGLVAQQVEKVFPEMVSMGEDGYRRVNYGQLPYLLLQGVRELKASNDKLRADAQIQRRENEQVQAEIAKLRRKTTDMGAKLARLDRQAAAKDLQLAAMSRQIEQLTKAQQQIAVSLSRFPPPQSENAKLQAAEVRAAINSSAARGPK